jgi:hypothetical protein
MKNRNTGSRLVITIETKANDWSGDSDWNLTNELIGVGCKTFGNQFA